jgi:site-specific DNA recombinase
MTKTLRCAVYTRKSSEEGLEQSFNSLHAQREACEAYIRSQRHEGWQLVKTVYNDGGFSGGNLNRPALEQLLQDVSDKKIDVVVVYKVDRLTRSLMDFAKIVERFDKHGVSFVSVTQQFNTTSSMGRLTLNVLLSFAQFEREVTGERIRDKIAASKRKGMWMGGVIPTGYDLKDRELVVNPSEAEQVRILFRLYLELGCVSKLKRHLERAGIRSKRRVSKTGNVSGETVYSRGALYKILNNRIYLGEITHKGTIYPGRHEAIIDRDLWNQIQQRLKGNLQASRKRPRATTTSLLTGLLYDDVGHRFTPSHAAKGGRRYRYYVAQAGSQKALRFPAPEIEEIVVRELQQLLKSPQRLLEVLVPPSVGPSSLQDLLSELEKRLALLLEGVSAAVPTIVRRAVIRNEGIEIHISKSVLRAFITGSATTEPNPDNDISVLTVDLQFLKYRGKVRLVLPPDSPHVKTTEVRSLIRAIARAHDWVDQILKGEARNQREIAVSVGLNERYVSRILPLAFLSPDITQAILDGKQAAGQSLEDFVGLPMTWSEQSRLLNIL